MTINKAILRIEHSSMSIDDKETADFIITILRRYKKIEQLVDEGIISRLTRVAYIVMGCYDGVDD